MRPGPWLLGVVLVVTGCAGGDAFSRGGAHSSNVLGWWETRGGRLVRVPPWCEGRAAGRGEFADAQACLPAPEDTAGEGRDAGAIATSSSHRDSVTTTPKAGTFVGWIMYLSRRGGAVPPLPAPVRVEPVDDKGTLIVLTPERFTVRNPEHVALAERVRELLDEAGLLKPLQAQPSRRRSASRQRLQVASVTLDLGDRLACSAARMTLDSMRPDSNPGRWKPVFQA
ncbi:immunity 52 family protein [Myxococcus guangdongensis]|uniref:immunity 52 family protein n=1 Tax=Myxococcus guangdongensis TaxID=2906760 RepID=UPI002B1FAFA5|nr:immunity 52 family protein [Myxococcus guangdongensis]